jgi:sirohydrochlorin cobaltochelatase
MGFTGSGNGRTVLKNCSVYERFLNASFSAVTTETERFKRKLIGFKPKSSLIVIGHGSTVNPDSSTPTFAHADTIRRKGLFAEVLCAFWKEEPSLREVLRMTETEEVYVVPHFISEGYFTQKVIPRELELTGPITRRDKQVIKYCEPVGNHPQMTDLLLQRVRQTAPQIAPEQTSLLIVGHGTGLNENSAVAVKTQVKRIRARRIYAEVGAAYIEEEPLIANWRALTQYPSVVVVPFFISDGLHSYEDIPVLLGIQSESTGAASRQEVFRRNPYRLGGRALYYSSAIGTDPMMAEIILEMVHRFDRKHFATAVSNEYDPRPA